MAVRTLQGIMMNSCDSTMKETGLHSVARGRGQRFLELLTNKSTKETQTFNQQVTDLTTIQGINTEMEKVFKDMEALEHRLVYLKHLRRRLAENVGGVKFVSQVKTDGQFVDADSE